MKIRLGLSEESIDNAIEQLKFYAASLSGKADEIKEQIADELVQEVDEGFNAADYDFLVEVDDQGNAYGPGQFKNIQHIDVDKSSDNSSVIASGKEALFIEFGAGVHFNGPAGGHGPHPEPVNGWSGLSPIGKFGHGFGSLQIWRYVDDETGETRYTAGTPASMPMYHAAKKVRGDIIKIAREVFKDGD